MNNLYKPSKLLIVFIMLCFLISCSVEDVVKNLSDKAFELDNITLTAEVNGKKYESGDSFVTAKLLLTDSGKFVLSVQGLNFDYANNNKWNMLEFSLAGKNFSEIGTGDKFDQSYYLNPSSLGIYGAFAESIYDDFPKQGVASGGNANIKFTITEIDKNNNVISGEFSFDGLKDNNNVYEVRNGKFNELKFKDSLVVEKDLYNEFNP